MKRIDNNGNRRKLNIEFIFKENGTKLEKILKEGYLYHLKNLKIK